MNILLQVFRIRTPFYLSPWSGLEERCWLAKNKKEINPLCTAVIFALVFLLSSTKILTASDCLRTIALPLDGWERPPLYILPQQKVERPRIGLALSGGGLRGVAQIAALQAFEDRNIPIDCMVGTSIGAIIGGLYASGYTPDELWQLLNQLDFGDILRDRPQRSSLFLGQKEKGRQPILQIRLDGLTPTLPEAYTPGQKLTELLTDLILRAPHHAQEFDRLHVPLRIIATDLLQGKKVVMAAGDLVTAIRASVAIPLLISPVEYSQSLLVDGGLMDNIPVSETRTLGADLVIAIDTTSPLRQREAIRAPWEVADQVTTIMQVPIKQAELAGADFIVSLSDLQMNSMEATKKIFQTLYDEGYRRTSLVIDELEATLQKYQEQSCSNAAIWHFANFRLENVPQEAIADLHIAKKNRLSECEIAQDLYKIYHTGNYRDVSAAILAEEQDTVLVYRGTFHPVLKKITFRGNTIFADSVLIQPFNALLEKNINQGSSRKALLEVIKMYKSNGYVLAALETVIFEPTDGTATVEIDEGRIGQIVYSGNKKTKDYVISRDFTIKSGQVFQLGLAKENISNIYASGLFQSVVLKPIPTETGWDIRLDLQEQLSTSFRLGMAYNLERYGRVFAEYSDDNFLGTANDLSFNVLYGLRDLQTGVTLRADRIFQTLFTGGIDLLYTETMHHYYQNHNLQGEYGRKTHGIHLNLGRQIERLGTISGFMRFNKIELQSHSGSGYDVGKMNISTLGLISTIDARDQVPFPRSGKFHQFYYEVSSGKFLGADLSYFKVQNQLSSFWTFRRRNTVSPKLFWGTSDLTLPFSEQFRLGGINSFYGLREDDFVGRHAFVTSLEYRYFLPWKSFVNIYLSTRFDFGAVWEKSVDIKPKDFISGKGLALSFATPAGPFTVAYGKASLGREQFYLQFGYGF